VTENELSDFSEVWQHSCVL